MKLIAKYIHHLFPLFFSRITVLVLFFLIFSLQLAGQTIDSWTEYLLGQGNMRMDDQRSEGMIVQMKKIKKRSEVAADGLRVIRKLEDSIYLVHVSSNLNNHDYLKEIGPSNHLWKLILSNEDPEQDVLKSRNFLIQIKPSADQNKPWFKELKEVSAHQGIYSFKGELSFILETLVSDDDVAFITEESIDPQTESLVRRMNLHPNRVGKVHHLYPSYNGKARVVSIQENLYDADDIDLLGRDIPSDVAAVGEPDAHATDMATIIAGAGNSFVTGRGVLASASITSSDFADVLPDDDALYEQMDIYLQNHSYGTSMEEFYGIQARAFDLSAFHNPYLLHVFSSGNQGEETSDSGKYSDLTGYGNLTGNFKTAKNVLVVGAVDLESQEVVFSSRGPTYDERVKPELVAYGEEGSSNAAALVSGVSGLLQQSFQESYQSEMPASLLKACLINGADDAGVSGLDHVTGYGNVNAYESLNSVLSGYFFTDTLAFNEEVIFNLDLPEDAVNLKLTICWTDLPAEVGNRSALINDLDMTLVTPDGDEIYPWVLNTDAVATALAQSAKRGEDHLNNVEQITLQNSEAGLYQVKVKGYDVQHTYSQPFFIAYSWEEKDQFEWDFPRENDPVPFDGESDTYLYWSSGYENQTGKLEFSQNGLTWILLEDGIDLSSGYWKWDSIPLINSEGVLRMTIDGKEFISETFVFSQFLSLSLGVNCGDSIMLQWPKIEEAQTYKVSTLEGNYMQETFTVADTFLVLNKTDLNAPYVRVHAALSEGAPTLPSFTYDYNQLGGSCFISFFFQEEVPNEGINLHLNLGTTLGINEIIFERKTEEEYVLVEHLIPPLVSSISVLDDQPGEGLNEHRVTLMMENGEEVHATASSAYHFRNNDILVFPNPVNRSDRLNLFTDSLDEGEAFFRLHDYQGTEVLYLNLSGSRESIPINNLRSGLYFYSLEYQQNISYGKLVIE